MDNRHIHSNNDDEDVNINEVVRAFIEQREDDEHVDPFIKTMSQYVTLCVRNVNIEVPVFT